jgi:hypothetical protein
MKALPTPPTPKEYLLVPNEPEEERGVDTKYGDENASHLGGIADGQK